MDFACDIGDGFQRWFRGLPNPSYLFTPFHEDFYIYIIGCIMRYVKIEKKGPNRVKNLGVFKHGFDGVSCLEANVLREVYALAEKSMNPRVHIFRIDHSRKDLYEPRVIAKLRGIQSSEIRALRFNKNELIIVLTGYPTFNLSIWKWTTEQELMVALCNEPSMFSDLLISPSNDCHWVEYGKKHMTYYDLQSFTKNDVIRTQIYMPQRQVTLDKPDLLIGQDFAMTIVSACFTWLGDFYVLDDHLGLHILNQNAKVLNWLCSIGFGFLGSEISRIVPFADCIAEVHTNGWILAYDIASSSGKMRVRRTFKMTSNILHYYQFADSSTSFFAITEKDGLIEGVEEGILREPLAIPDLMYSNVRSVTFIEPGADYVAVLSESGRVTILESETGEPIEKWKLAFKPTSILCHPVLPFFFCGTSYGCVNILDIRNLKRPKLIHKTYLSKEVNNAFTKLALVCQGRYLVSADTVNDRIYLQYGYPFEEFEYLDSAKLPGEIRHLNVPGCGKEDLRIQVMVYAKNKVDEICPNYVYNYALNNDRLNCVASQSIEHPIKAIALNPLKNYLYTYNVEKKQLGLTPYCDDNAWTVLQEPDVAVDYSFTMDLNRMIFHGNKLYTFGEDGKIMAHEPPVQRQRDQPVLLNTICTVETHMFIDKGIKDGVISLDGTQVIALGNDGTFTRVRILPKPPVIDWDLLGYDKPNLVEYQMASFQLSQEFVKMGPLVNRIDLIRIGLQPQPTGGEDDIPQLPRPIPIPTEKSVAIADKQMLKTERKKRRHAKSKKNLRGGTEEMEDEHSDEEEWEGEGEEWDEEGYYEGYLSGHKFGQGHEAIEEEQAPEKRKKKRSELRRQLEGEAQALRDAAQAQKRAEDITEEDIKVLMDSTNTVEKQPEVEKPKPKQPEVVPSATSATASESRQDTKPKSKTKSRRDKIKKMRSKYKNIKSKVGAQMRGEDKKKESLTDEAEDDFIQEEKPKRKTPEVILIEGVATDDNELRSMVGEISEVVVEPKITQVVQRGKRVKKRAKVMKSKLKGKDRKGKKKVKEVKVEVVEEEEEREVKDIFDTEEVNIIQFARPEKEVEIFDEMFEGVDGDGVVCVGYAIKDGELTAPEFWSKYEYALKLRQHSPKAIKLKEEFLRLLELLQTIMTFNSTREPNYQVDITEFNLDDYIKDQLAEKGAKFVQYCHIVMQARNNLRKERIEAYKNMIWEPWEHKGRIFMGVQSPTIVNNYPLKPRKDTFGTTVSQVQEERRLELKIESVETKIYELANGIVLEILKAEVEYVAPEDRQQYIRNILTVDPNAKFDDNQDPTKKGEFMITVLQELGIDPGLGGLNLTDLQAQSLMEKPSRIIKRGKASEKSDIAFGTHLTKTVRRRVDSSSAPSTTSTVSRTPSQSRKRKKAKPRTESEVRQRILRRRRVDQDTDPDTEEDSETGEIREKDPKSRVMFDRTYGLPDLESTLSSRAAVKLKASKKIKKVALILKLAGPSAAASASKKLREKDLKALERKEKEEKKEERRKKRKSKRGEKFVVVSDEDDEDHIEIKKTESQLLEEEQLMLAPHINVEDPGDKDEQEIVKVRQLKYSAMEEELLSQYLNVSRQFAGNLLHELVDMHKYKPNPYRYHQFEIHARHQLVRQISLAYDEVYRLKLCFNNLFNQAREFKADVLNKMAERNKRIRDIYYYLKMDLDILDDKFDPQEDPSLVFKVTKEEIPIEKYLTEEQKVQEEKEKQLEFDINKEYHVAFRHKKHNEPKKEKILLQDVPKPEFMIARDIFDWTFDEYVESLEYKKDCEKLEKAREEMTVELQEELGQLYRANVLDYSSMDMRLQELYMAKKQFQYNILMEECSVTRAIKLMRILDDCQCEEDRVNGMLLKLQDGMKSTQLLVAQLNARRKECQEKEQDVTEKQRDLEKRFRKELGDVGQFFEYFLKNYKKKPKISAKGLDKGEIYEQGVKALKSPNIRAYGRENGEAGKVVVLGIMDIEDPMFMPDGCPRTYWDKFNKLRRERLACDFEIKSLSLEMQHIGDGLEECKEREDQTAKAMAAILAILSHRTEMKNYFMYNTEFQFIIGKGNVEINFWELRGHDNSVMTLAENIERFNAHIATAADTYIKDIKKSIQIRRDVKEIEWKFAVTRLSLADAQQLLHDVNSSRPRRELLRMLAQGVDLDTMFEQKIERVKYLQVNSEKFQNIYLGARGRLRKMYEKQTDRQEKATHNLRQWLGEENKKTSLLRQTGIKASPEQQQKKYNDRVNKFLMKGYMMHKIHDNCQTINFLEAELARYYQKSYPCL